VVATAAGRGGHGACGDAWDVVGPLAHVHGGCCSRMPKTCEGGHVRASEARLVTDARCRRH